MTEVELRGCHKCGGQPKILVVCEKPDDFDREYIIRCDDCAIEQCAEYLRDAIEAWNTRAPSPEAEAMAEAAQNVIGTWVISSPKGNLGLAIKDLDEALTAYRSSQKEGK